MAFNLGPSFTRQPKRISRRPRQIGGGQSPPGFPIQQPKIIGPPNSPPGMPIQPKPIIGGGVSPPGMSPNQFDPNAFSKMLNPQQQKDFAALGRNTGNNYMAWGTNAAKGAGLTATPEEMLRKRYGIGPSGPALKKLFI